MAISKLILNGEIQMDVTSDTVVAGSMLSGTTATKNDGTKITGNITTKTSSDLTVSGATVTAPAGYYANAASKAVTTTTHPNPTASITSSTGVVTASHTQTAGYVTAGTTTGTLNLTTQAAQTINTSTADQTIASNRWLTGTQTIKSVTTSNLTAANIAEGVVVQVGDANNASRITQVTGTHSGATSYTATISGSGNTTYCYVTYSGTKYYSNNGTFSFKAGDTLTIYCRGNSVSINGQSVTLSSYSYTYTLPVGDITINLTYSSSTSNNIAIYGLVKPTGAYTVSAAGTHNIYNYSQATVTTGSAFPPAVTITKAPTFSMNSATGVVTASYTGSSSITPTVNAGYITAGTAGTVSTSGTSTYQLTSQAGQTIYPSTADQTIASYRWLTGTQTIKSVTTSNLTPENIAEGVVVKVGDANNASRITQVTGTHSGGDEAPTHTLTLTGAGGSGTFYIEYNDVIYYNPAIITFTVGGTLHLHGVATSEGYMVIVNINGQGRAYDSTVDFYYTLPDHDIYINLTVNTSGQTRSFTWTSPQINIVNNGTYDVADYGMANVQIPGGFTVDQIAMRSISGDISGVAIAISAYAFAYCSRLTTASFPSCTSINSYAFAYCYSLTTVSFPTCTSIGSFAFYDCNRLTTASFPSCTSINGSAFAYCSGLTTASFPACATIGASAFDRCYSLTTASFPTCTRISAYAFAYCSSLTTASFPSCTSINSNAFAYCYSLTTASFPSCTSISTYAFRNCYNLLSIYFLGSSIPILASTAFMSTPISNYTTSTGGVYGSIFVPSSLYNSYITATNWAIYSDRIVSV